MLVTNPPIPTSLTIAIWSLRSVPITLLILMFMYNSGSINILRTNLHFWFDAIAVLGVVAIITYWNWLKRLRWNVSFTIYLYIFTIYILRNPYEILTASSTGSLGAIDWQSIFKSFWFGGGIFAIGMLLEIPVFYLRQSKSWAWWTAFAVSICYVASMVFFFSGTLGVWSLLDSDTKSYFRSCLRDRKA
jgi:hypothetical protein